MKQFSNRFSGVFNFKMIFDILPILAQIAAIVLLLRRAFKFVVKISILFTKLHQTNDPAIKDKLKPPSIPKSIQNLIQLE